MTAPIDYGLRATQRPAPPGLIDDYTFAHLSNEHAYSFAATTGWYFFADIAEYQALIDARYPYQSLGCRLDTGYRLDSHAPANVATWKQMRRAGVLLGYIVFIPGRFPAQLARLRNAFGAQLEGIVPELDMESGGGFAGPGDHSTEANDCMAELAQITGTPARQGGYANGSDWASLWRTRPTSMPRRLADYGPTIASTGYWAQQFYGGLNYPVPDGFPRACAPFGGWVDLNATRLTPDQNKALFGLNPPPPPPAPPSPEVASMYYICQADKRTFPGPMASACFKVWATGDGSMHAAHILSLAEWQALLRLGVPVGRPITYGDARMLGASL